MFRREEPTLKGKINFVKYFILFSSISTCGSVIINVRVGEKAQLDFPYPCDSAVVTLQHANQRPFYRSADPQYKSLSSNQNLLNDTETGLDQCFLNLTINPVSRVDQGTYILTAYKNGAMLPDYPRIYLGVDYLPGKAWCEKSNDYNDGEWVLLQCTALVEPLTGQILCYQNDMKLPKGYTCTPTESDGNLNQVILARLDGVVYCCLSILTGMKDKCNCTDWRWNPISDSISDIADPCPQAMSTEDPTSTHSIAVDNSSLSNLLTAQAKHPENHKINSYWIVTWVFWVICFGIIITLSIKYHHKVKELEHLISSITPESKDPCLPVNREEVLEHNV